MNSSRTRQASATLLALVALVTAVLTVASSATANPSIDSKRAQAQAILAEIHETDAELEQAIEAYNYANVQLDEIDADLRSNARHLAVARKSLGTAQANVADRLRSLYVNGDTAGAVEIILGAESLDDLLNRLDMVERVSDQDAKVLTDVRAFRKEVENRRERLGAARTAQARVVADRASQKQWIEGQLAERERKLAGIQDEIRQLQEEEARRQAVLAAQARARLAAQQAAANAARVAASDAATAVPLAATATDADAATTEDVITPAPPSQYGGVVGIAMQYLGVPYVWGGAGPGGFDCSGLVSYVYAQVGVSLPHHAASIYNLGTPVSYSDLQAGDLVFFSGLGHMGIYIGGGQFIHAPHTGDVVKISNMSDHGSYVGAKRL
jgi:cell wall-associated NlpC family hydrolase